MAIEVTVGEPKTQEEKPFPKLMLNVEKDYVILANSDCSGTIVWSIYPDFKVGLYKDRWIIKNFSDFNEPITLKNK